MDKYCEKEINFGDMCFGIGYLILIGIYFMYTSTSLSYKYNFSDKVILIKILAYGFLIFKIMFTKYRFKEIILYSIILSIVIISYKHSSDKTLLHCFFFIMSSKNVNLKYIFKKEIILLISCIMVMFVLTLLGIADNITIDIGTRLKYSLGFLHPNTLAILCLKISLLYGVVNFEKITAKFYILNIIGGILVYLITISRTILICFLIYLFGIFIFKQSNYFKKLLKSKKFIKTIQTLIFIVPVIIIYIGANFYQENSMLSILNVLLSGRIALINKFYNIYGIKLWGQQVTQTSYYLRMNENSSNMVLDCAYARLIIIYGIIMLLVFILGYGMLVKKLMSEKEYKFIFPIFIFIILGISESAFLNIYFNFTILLLYTCFTKDY